MLLKRDRKSDVIRIGRLLPPVVEQGAVVVVFPEGTSTDGGIVRPFRSALLDPAVEQNRPVAPVWMGYALADGSAENEVCYWRGMTYVPHFLNLLSKRAIRARVVYGTPIEGATGGKEPARALQARICSPATQTSLRCFTPVVVGKTPGR